MTIDYFRDTSKNSSPTPRKRGYANSRYNATKLGVHSSRLVLPWEDHKELEELLRSKIDEFKPATGEECELVFELIQISVWRKRLLIAERAVIMDELSKTLEEKLRTGNASIAFLGQHFTSDDGFHIDLDSAFMAPPSVLKKDWEDIDRAIMDIMEAIAQLKVAAKKGQGDDEELIQGALDGLPEDLKEEVESALAMDEITLDEEVSLALEVVDYMKENFLPRFAQFYAELIARDNFPDQAIGMALCSDALQKLEQRKALLDRRHERVLAKLLRLQELRKSNGTG